MRAPAIAIEGAARIGGEPVFAALRLSVPAGGWTCLLGASGAGKSTLLRLLAGLGNGIAFDGSIAADDGLAVPPRTILMQQADMLLPWANVLANVTIGARLRGEALDLARANDLLNKVGLAGLGHRLPSELSGGQRQRVALARTLAEDRPIVLLDEPFSALDPATRRQMQELSLAVLTGRTVVMVTHDPLEAARLGDTIAVMTSSGTRQVNLSDATTQERAALLLSHLAEAAA